MTGNVRVWCTDCVEAFHRGTCVELGRERLVTPLAQWFGCRKQWPVVSPTRNAARLPSRGSSLLQSESFTQHRGKGLELYLHTPSDSLTAYVNVLNHVIYD